MYLQTGLRKQEKHEYNGQHEVLIYLWVYVLLNVSLLFLKLMNIKSRRREIDFPYFKIV